MSSSKFPNSSYSKVPPELLARYAKQLVDELPPSYLFMGHRYNWQVNLTILRLRSETVKSYRDQVQRGTKSDIFMHYLHNFSLAKDSPLYNAVVDEIKVRRLARIL